MLLGALLRLVQVVGPRQQIATSERQKPTKAYFAAPRKRSNEYTAGKVTNSMNYEICSCTPNSLLVCAISALFSGIDAYCTCWKSISIVRLHTYTPLLSRNGDRQARQDKPKRP